MPELIIVILIVGILALIALPKVEQDRTPEAVDEIMQAIRYTQMLNMQNNRSDPNDPDWYKKRWVFFVKDWGYSVVRVTDIDREKFEYAPDPLYPGRVLKSGEIYYHDGFQCCNLTPRDHYKINPRAEVFMKHGLHFTQAALTYPHFALTYPQYKKKYGESIFSVYCGGNIIGGMEQIRGCNIAFDEFGRPINYNISSNYNKKYVPSSWYNPRDAGFWIVVAGHKTVGIIKIEEETGFMKVKYYDKSELLRYGGDGFLLNGSPFKGLASPTAALGSDFD